MYDAELFQGVLPRLKGTVDTNGMSFAEIATGIQEADTAGWSESWEVLSNRILTGFESIALDLEKQGGGNALVVSHGMTIATLAHLLDPERGQMLCWIMAQLQFSSMRMDRSSLNHLGTCPIASEEQN